MAGEARAAARSAWPVVPRGLRGDVERVAGDSPWRSAQFGSGERAADAGGRRGSASGQRTATTFTDVAPAEENACTVMRIVDNDTVT